MVKRMTVREYRELLSKLDQDKCIWCITNEPTIRPVPPQIEVALEGDERLFEEDGLKKGDYIITEIEKQQ